MTQNIGNGLNSLLVFLCLFLLLSQEGVISLALEIGLAETRIFDILMLMTPLAGIHLVSPSAPKLTESGLSGDSVKFKRGKVNIISSLDFSKLLLPS